MSKELDLAEAAWGVIANAGGWDDPGCASPGWREAAERWRDQYHDLLREHGYMSPDVSSGVPVTKPKEQQQ